MTTFASLNGTRIMGAYVQDTDEGIPTPVTEVPDRDSWPTRPSLDHQANWIDSEIVWLDPRTNEEKAEAARLRRDAELAESDWVVTRAFEQGTAVPSLWAAYRQALRDIPQQVVFPNSITWPTIP